MNWLLGIVVYFILLFFALAFVRGASIVSNRNERTD